MLSSRVKYAIHALIYIHEQNAHTPLSAKKIAEAKKIPFKFLESILQELKQAAIIKSQRGPSGGYGFLKNPDDVTIASVMRIIDGPIALTSCTSENFYDTCDECLSEHECEIKAVFRDLRTQMLPVLNRSITELSKLSK